MSKPIRWAYGVTTVEERRKTLLPQTLESLCRAGFDDPRLFVDNCRDLLGYVAEFGLPTTVHAVAPGWGSKRTEVGLRTAGNWHAALLELWIRCPRADRYAIFQDDLVTSVGLREYLEATPYPASGYCNLFTFPPKPSPGCRIVQAPPPSPDYVGWYPARVRANDGGPTGYGAVALVFDHATAKALLSSRYLVERHECPLNGHQKIDGGIAEALIREGIKEYVHNPSLVQHTGYDSTRAEMKERQTKNGGMRFSDAETFRGEDFDLRELIKK